MGSNNIMLIDSKESCTNVNNIYKYTSFKNKNSIIENTNNCVPIYTQ